MDVEVLPGPSLAERARTAVTQARLAAVTWDDPEPGRGRRVTATAAIRDGGAGAPLLLLAPREAVTEALADYRAAEPDPLWRVAASAIQHLERGHMAELICCLRAHGMHRAEWVVPRGLDRFGLELAVISSHGVAAVRLSFPDGPVGSLEEVPASLRAVLACRCWPARPESEAESEAG
jgi:hypothetical protein